MHIYGPSLIPRLCAALSRHLHIHAVCVVQGSYTLFNDSSPLRGKFLMPEIENRPVVFFFFCPFWRSSPDCIAAAQLARRRMAPVFSAPAWVTTEDKPERACPKKNEEVNRKRQDGEWTCNIWRCGFKCVIALSEWQIFSRICLHLNSKLAFITICPLFSLRFEIPEFHFKAELLKN